VSGRNCDQQHREQPNSTCHREAATWCCKLHRSTHLDTQLYAGTVPHGMPQRIMYMADVLGN
jgi:hypothetical protein